MTEWQLAILALIQGFTEFLPVSSSAHLILPSQLLGWPDQGLAVDIAVHVGSLFAVVAYYRKDVSVMALGSWQTLVDHAWNPASRLVALLVLATLPAVAAGLLLGSLVEEGARSALLIGVNTLLFAAVLALADWRGRRNGNDLLEISIVFALLLGCAQAVAIFPGVSRSGITISAGLLLGLGYLSAARFSFLMSIPVIAAAGCYKVVQLLGSPDPVVWRELLLAAVLSAVTAYAAIAIFLRFLARVGLMPFVWYRIVLGLGLCIWSLT